MKAVSSLAIMMIVLAFVATIFIGTTGVQAALLRDLKGSSKGGSKKGPKGSGSKSSSSSSSSKAPKGSTSNSRSSKGSKGPKGKKKKTMTGSKASKNMNFNISTCHFCPYAAEAEELSARQESLHKTNPIVFWYQTDDSNRGGGGGNNEPPRTGNEAVDDALKQLELLMERTEQSNSRTSSMQTAINEMHKKLFEGQTSGDGGFTLEDVKAVTEIATTVFGALDKFESGDRNQIIVGSMEVIAVVGKRLPVLGPFIELGAVIVGGIFGRNRDPSVPAEDRTESIVDRVVREALSDFRDEELQDLALGTIQTMRNDNTFIEHQLQVHPDTRSEAETLNLRMKLTNGNYGYNSGVNMMNQLLSHIERNIRTVEKREADRIAGQLSTYVHLQVLRERQIAALSVLWATLGDQNLMGSYNAVIEKEHTVTAPMLKVLTEVPSVQRQRGQDPYKVPSHRMIIGSLYTRISNGERLSIEFFMANSLGTRIPGVTRRIVTTISHMTSNMQPDGRRFPECVIHLGRKRWYNQDYQVFGTATDRTCERSNTLFRVYGGRPFFGSLGIRDLQFFSPATDSFLSHGGPPSPSSNPNTVNEGSWISDPSISEVRGYLLEGAARDSNNEIVPFAEIHPDAQRGINLGRNPILVPGRTRGMYPGREYLEIRTTPLAGVVDRAWKGWVFETINGTNVLPEDVYDGY